jgi:hypothetical protein
VSLVLQVVGRLETGLAAAAGQKAAWGMGRAAGVMLTAATGRQEACKKE